MAMIGKHVASNCRKEKPAKLRYLKVWDILRQCVFDQGLQLDLLPVKAFHCFQGREQLLLEEKYRAVAESEISSGVIGIEPASFSTKPIERPPLRALVGRVRRESAGWEEKSFFGVLWQKHFPQGGHGGQSVCQSSGCFCIMCQIQTG